MDLSGSIQNTNKGRNNLKLTRMPLEEVARLCEQEEEAVVVV